MKSNTDYLDIPVTFERVGIFGCGLQQTYPMNILFQQTKNKWIEKKSESLGFLSGGFYVF